MAVHESAFTENHPSCLAEDTPITSPKTSKTKANKTIRLCLL